MKMGHFEMVTTLLTAMALTGIFQVKAEVLDMAEDAFDDEYLKCNDRLEMKYIPQLLKEEMTNDQLLEVVWDNAEIKWEDRKAQISLPTDFKDTYGIALMAYVSEAQEQTTFYYTFDKAVREAGQSRKDYIYDFPFKAFHFYLTRALQMLRRPCEESYGSVVYSTAPAISFTFGELNQARLGKFTLAYSAKPPTANNSQVLTIHTCFGVAVEKFLDKESERVVLIPLSEVFHVLQEGTPNDFVLQSTNKTCSYYECSFLGGLKSEHCIQNQDYIKPVRVGSPDLEDQKLQDSGRKRPDSSEVSGIKVLQPDENPLQPKEELDQGPGPVPVPVPVPGPKTHPSASSGKMLLPSVTASIILIIASAVNVFTAL